MTWPLSAETSVNDTPVSLSTSSRTWFECQVPRDLTMVSILFRSPLRITFGK